MTALPIGRYWVPVAIVSLGFVVRLFTAFRADLHADELYDLFAAEMISKHGIPIYPSGMLWVAGGPLAYAEAPFVALFGLFSQFNRLPSVIFSTGSIWLLYLLGDAMFGRRAATAAALAWAFDPDAVLWGAYARQYALHPLMVFLSVALLRNAAMLGGAGRSIGAAIALVVTFWVQPPTLLFLPGFAAAYMIWTDRLELRPLLPAIACGVIGSLAVICLVYFGDPGLIESAEAQGGSIVLPPPTISGLLDIGGRYIPFLTTHPGRGFLFFFAAVTATVVALQLVIGLRLRFRALPAANRDVLAVAMLLLFSLLGLGLFRYQQPGYALALLGPMFLLGAHGLDSLANALSFGHLATSGQRSELWTLGGRPIWVAPLLVVICLLGSTSELRRNSKPGAGDGQSEAYAYVGEAWRSGDAWLNANIQTWIYAAGRDPHFFYLCASSCGLGLMRTDRGYVNRFIGAPQVSTEAEVERILDAYSRAWFVVKQSDWEDDRRMPPEIRRLILARMEVVFKRNLATVFLSAGR